MIEKARKAARLLAANEAVNVMQEAILVAKDRSIEPGRRFPYIKFVVEHGIGRVEQAVKIDHTAEGTLNVLTGIGELFAGFKPGDIIDIQAEEVIEDEELELAQIESDLAKTRDTV